MPRRSPFQIIWCTVKTSGTIDFTVRELCLGAPKFPLQDRRCFGVLVFLRPFNIGESDARGDFSLIMLYCSHNFLGLANTTTIGYRQKPQVPADFLPSRDSSCLPRGLGIAGSLRQFVF